MHQALSSRSSTDTPRENTGLNLHGRGTGDGFLDTKSTSSQSKNRFDTLKIKNFRASKGTIEKVKREPTERGKHVQITYLISVQNI